MSTRDHGPVVAAAMAMFVAWTLATWVYEGRIDTLLRPDATTDRLVYALGVNLLLGVIGSVWLLRWLRIRYGAPTNERSGFGGRSRTTSWSIVGIVLGGAIYFIQGAPSTHPGVVTNAYSQVFVVSAAEVLVCWALVGTAVESALGPSIGRFAVLVAAVVSALLFGLHHFAHSAPFNTWPMVGLLSFVGIVTGLFFFVSRDVLATALFHNALGTFGVTQALEKAGSLRSLEVIQPSLLGTALLTVLVLVAARPIVAGRR